VSKALHDDARSRNNDSVRDYNSSKRGLFRKIARNYSYPRIFVNSDVTEQGESLVKTYASPTVVI
jgi:hypothetical protein